jgi:hypothetical protein
MVKINKFSFVFIVKFPVTPLCSSTAKKSSFTKRYRSQNRNSNERFPPPPPEFLYDNPKDKQPIIRAMGPGLKDGFVDDHCSYIFYFLILKNEFLF